MYKNYIKIKKFLSINSCNKIIQEIDNFSKFDDLVMNGRNRINKGSNNFREFLSKSPNANYFFKKMNSVFFFKRLKKKIIDNDKNIWKLQLDKFKFSKSIFGVQKGKKITNKLTDMKKNIIYLDMDFSVSKKGYYRGPHRDRDTRIINFLIYLNSLKKNDGGKLYFYNIKNKTKFVYSRFPKSKELKVGDSFNARKGLGIFFLSSPNSYHSVSKFLGKKDKKRYFIYGSYSLNKRVSWMQKLISLNDNIQ